MEELIKAALKSYQDKNYKEALDYFENALEMDNNNPVILSNIGLCYSKLQDEKKAQEYYLRALSIDNKLVQTIINLSDSFVKTSDILKAIELLQNSVYQLPDNNVIKHYLARTYIIDKRLIEAIDVLSDILETDPENYEASWDLAQVYFDLGNWESAITNYENVLEKKSDSPFIFYQTALAYEANDEIDKAMSNHLKAIVVNDKFAPSYKKLGILFLAKNDKDSAREYFEDYLQFSLNDDEKQDIENIIEKIKNKL